MARLRSQGYHLRRLRTYGRIGEPHVPPVIRTTRLKLASPKPARVVVSVTWADGPPIGMRINHGGTETTGKTREQLKLRALRAECFSTECCWAQATQRDES